MFYSTSGYLKGIEMNAWHNKEVLFFPIFPTHYGMLVYSHAVYSLEQLNAATFCILTPKVCKLPDLLNFIHIHNLIYGV